MWIQETTEQDEASPSGAQATQPPLHHVTWKRAGHETISTKADGSMNCIS